MFDVGDLPDPTADGSLAHVPTERLEEHMRALAGHLASALCSFLLLVAEFDRRDGAADWECLSTAHWLNWRCGIGLPAAREQVRVARRLEELPVVRAEFAAGRLSYSKVRAITRVAHPDIEAGLVRMAASATAAQMEQACRALRRSQDLDAAARDLADQEADAHANRAVSWTYTGDGEVTLRARLPVEAAETLIAAINHAAGPADGDTSVAQRRADALVTVAASYLAAPAPERPAAPELIVHIDTSAITEPGEPSEPGEPGEPAQWPVRTGSGAPLSFAALERLACDSGQRVVADLPDGTQLNWGRHRRTATPAQHRALRARDRHCTFPGCEQRSRLRAHHIRWWTRGGPTDLSNLTLLCPKHHRAVHEGGWTLTGTSDDLDYRRPDGQHVEPLVHLDGNAAELIRLHQRHGRDVAAEGPGGRWHGDHIDWDCFFAAFANPPPAGAA